jgi:S-adenosylmethionine decarboxylase proenzyme
MTIFNGDTRRADLEGKRNAKVTEVLHFEMHFFFGVLIASSLTAFVVGRVARMWILGVTAEDMTGVFNMGISAIRIIDTATTYVSANTMITLPDPILQYGKAVPRTMYTSKNFDTASATVHSRWIVTNSERGKCATLSCSPEISGASAQEHLEEEHLPSGQHLLLDLENIDSDFLNSEQRLATAMLELVDKCGLTLLSYHCHKVFPTGLSCIGVLLESHVSLHTWPSKGVITIDLFTCGPNSLLPVVPLVEHLFAIGSLKATGEKRNPRMVWAHKYRGFGGQTDIAAAVDVFYFPVGQMTDFKKEVCQDSFVVEGNHVISSLNSQVPV